VIDRHLTGYRSRYYSGSGDALFGWLDELVRKTWHEQSFSSPWAQTTRPTMQRFSDRDRVDRQPSSDHEVDPRRRPTGQEAPVASRPDAPRCSMTDQAPPQSVKSIGQKRKQLKRVEQAINFLRRELADGEVAAARLEEKAKASGISLRTLDRARARLKVISRRTGFAKTPRESEKIQTVSHRVGS
jgi:hypothetical protein